MHHGLVADVRSRIHRPAKALGLLAALVLVVAGATVSSAPAHAVTGTLSDVSLAVSNNATSSTDASNTATYTWQFTTATAAALTEIDLTVPAGTTGTPGAPVLYGLPGCSGTTALGGATVTVALTGCPSIPASSPVSIAVSGLTNTTEATTGFQTSVTTKSGDPAVVVDGPTSAGNGVDFSQNSTAVTVVVPDSLTFTNANTELTLLPVPGSSAPATGTVNLTVATNVAKGYSLSACVPTAITSGSSAISQLASPGALGGGVTAFGAKASVVAGSEGTDKDPKIENGLDSSYVGYQATCDTTSGDPSVIVTNGGTTNGDKVTITNGVSVSAVQEAGDYKGTILYRVAPSY